MLVTGDGRKSLVNRLRHRLNYIVRMIGFCVDIVDSIVRFGIRAVSSSCKFEGNIKEVDRFCTMLNSDFESMFLEFRGKQAASRFG